MGPDDVGDEFNETDEEAMTDPETIYDTVTVPVEGTLLIQTLHGDELTMQVERDDVRITFAGADDPEGATGTEYTIVVPRSAFAEALVSIGVVAHGNEGND
jgi:hypothetical protein